MTLLLLFLSSPNLSTLPTVTTQLPTDVTRTDATFNGQIVDDGTATITSRGFQFNTSPAPSQEVSEVGSFIEGAFTLDSNVELVPNTVYYVRAFAVNANGTGYGAWESFLTEPDIYSIVIGGIDRTRDVLTRTVSVNDVINDQQNTCGFSLMDLSGNGIPQTDDEIVITLDDGSVLFGGYIISLKLTYLEHGAVRADYTCVDYVRLLDRNLVHRTYENMTDAEIINDIVTRYCAGFGITTTNVIEGVTIDQISFNYIQPSQALKKLAGITGRSWYIDYQKDVHYFPLN